MRLRRALLILLLGLLLGGLAGRASSGILDLCPQDILPRPAAFTPGGLVLTSFDGAALWVYDIERSTRYPLPETRPCSAGCRLSPDGRWLLYLDPVSGLYSQMRPDGTQRTPLFNNAADVQWWSADTFLVWTPDHQAYLQQVGADPSARRYLPLGPTLAIQPGGWWAAALAARDGQFWRVMIHLEDAARPPVLLGADTPYFNALAWSPDGRWLAYVGRSAFDETIQTQGAELFVIQPGAAVPQQMTYFGADVGAVRVGGYYPASLYWSPDGQRIAFWVTPLTGSDPAASTASATLHVLEVATGQLVRYCGFSTPDHTPNPPRPVWSPDASHIAFAGNVPGDDKGYLLLALNVATGMITALSDGIFPAPAIPDVVAWGRKPE